VIYANFSSTRFLAQQQRFQEHLDYRRDDGRIDVITLSVVV
jgi:hypothetical protein